MAHSITAIVAAAPINEAAAIKHGLPVIHEGAFVMVPLPIEYIWELAPDEDHGDEPTGLFNSQAPHRLASELEMKAYALIETDYFGGVGDQRASYHNAEGAELRDVSINEALKELGVTRSKAYVEPTPRAAPHGWWARLRSRWVKSDPAVPGKLTELDEFDSINLSEYRSMEDFRFWKAGMQGQRVGNILVGDRRVLG